MLSGVALAQEAGTLSLSADQASIIVAGAEIASTVVSLLVVDRLGRRMLLMSSAAVMALCCFVLGAYFYLNVSAVSTTTGRGLPPCLV